MYVDSSEMNITGRLPSVKPVIQDLKPNLHDLTRRHACLEVKSREFAARYSRVAERSEQQFRCHRIMDGARKPKGSKFEEVFCRL